MSEVISIGPFMIRTSLLLLIASGMAGYYVMNLFLKRSVHRGVPLMEKVTNSVLIVFVVWKLSPLFYNPSLIWENPFALLLASGPTVGIWIGSVIGGCYFLWSLNRIPVPKAVVGDLLAIGTVTCLGVYSILGWQYGTVTTLPWGISQLSDDYQYHPINAYKLLVAVPFWFWLWKQSKSELGMGHMFRAVLIYGGMGMMLVTLFKQKIPLLIGLSGEQFMYLIMMLTGYVLYTAKGKVKSSE